MTRTEPRSPVAPSIRTQTLTPPDGAHAGGRGDRPRRGRESRRGDARKDDECFDRCAETAQSARFLSPS